jgi:predicted transcriptional regulator
MADVSNSLIGPTASLVTAFASNQKVAATDIPELIAAVHKALSGLGLPETTTAETVRLTSAQIRRSVTPDAIISFEDGKGYKTLKRHLATRGMTVSQYKTKWGLPSDYPATAPTYSAKRSAMAKSLGLGARGRKSASAATAPDAARARPAPTSKPARGQRKNAAPGPA